MLQIHYQSTVELMSDDGLAWDLAGIPVVIVGGMLLHFCFDWGGRRPVLAVFCPINESVWEHLKMAYWPLVALTGVQLAFSDHPPPLVASRAIGFYAMCVLIVGLYYLSTVMVPRAGLRTRLALDGGTFVLAVTAGQWVSHAVTVVSDGPGAAWAGSMGMVAPVAIFALTTFAPPHADVFRDQMTGGYGLAAGEHPGPGQAH